MAINKKPTYTPPAILLTDSRCELMQTPKSLPKGNDDDPIIEDPEEDTRYWFNRPTEEDLNMEWEK